MEVLALKRIVVLVGVVMIAVMTAVSVVRAIDTAASSPWVEATNPTLELSQELPANVLPPTSNSNCTAQKVKVFGYSGQSDDCLITVPSGQMGYNGVIFSGSNESIPVVPEWPYFNLQPIPNQSLTMTYSSSPVVGLYLHFYRSFRSRISSMPEFVNGGWQYVLRGAADFSLRGADNKLLPINLYTMAFSANGSWMVVDVPWQGFVRVNLATFEMLPFAPSLQQGSDYSSQGAQLTISNDGRYVIIKPQNFDQLKVYDLTKCTASTSLPVAPGADRCASRDYWGYINTHIAGFRGLYQPHFMNNDQISFTAVHDFVSASNFKSANYTLTAPGLPVSGIQYLGMGDSFASGEGAHMYMDGTDTPNNTCHLSSRSYAYLISSQLFSSGHSVACSGAVTEDIINTSNEYNGQVKDGVIKGKRNKEFKDSVITNYTPGFLAQSEFVDKYRPDTITLSIGGNDMGFGNIIQRCVQPSLRQPTCYPTYEDRLELFKSISNKFNRLVGTYKTIAKPGKRVYIIGYPQLVKPDGNCALNVGLNAQELQFAVDLTTHINDVLKQAAAKAGVQFVDVSQAFVGHRLCEATSDNIAVNGLTAGRDAGIGNLHFLGSESYHPNALGHELLARAILGYTNNLKAIMPLVQNSAQSPGVPASLDGQNLPKTGRSTRDVVVESTIAPDVVIRGQATTVKITESTVILKPNTAYTLVIESAENTPVTVTTSVLGELQATMQIPGSVTTGLHTLHVYGSNMLGQPLDVTKTVYVAASSDDFNGDGTPNSTDPCIFLPASGRDIDKDGIDDACDGFITDAPHQSGPWQISSSVKLIQNSITIIRPTP